MTECPCPVLDTATYRVGKKRRAALVIFPLTSCPLHAEFGVLDAPPPWWSAPLKKGVADAER
jgi:hypothetical protein